MRMHVYFLAALVAVIGCLKSSEPPKQPGPIAGYSPSWNDETTPPPSLPAPDFDDVGAPEPSPDPVSAAAGHTGYTGAIVYTDPARCTPCRYLEKDLKWLATVHKWTVGTTGNEDWVFRAPESRHKIIPTVEFYENGRQVDQYVGYSSSADTPTRHAVLKNLISKHAAAANPQAKQCHSHQPLVGVTNHSVLVTAAGHPPAVVATAAAGSVTPVAFSCFTRSVRTVIRPARLSQVKLSITSSP